MMKNRMTKLSLLLFSVLLVLSACKKPAVSTIEPGPVSSDVTTTDPPKQKNEVVMIIKKWKPDESRRQQAVSLNKQGLDSYKEGRIKEAAEYFRLAILEDSTHLYCHYNLACMLSLLLGQGEVIDRTEIFDELAIAIGLNAVQPDEKKDWVIQRMKTDTDLDAVRDNEKFQSLPESEVPDIPDFRDFLPGKWTNGRFYTLEFKETSYTYQKSSSGKTGQRKEGSWYFDISTMKYVLSGGPFPYSVYVPERNETRESSTNTLVFDPVRYIIRFIDEESDYDVRQTSNNEFESSPDSGVEFYREMSPLHEALVAMDMMKIAALIGQNILPDYKCQQCPSPGYPLELAITSERIALIRLFIGKEGIWPYQEMYIPEKHPYSLLLEEFREKSSRRLLDRIITRSEFSGNWYRKLFASPLSFPKEKLYGGYGCSNTLYPLGYSYRYLAFISNDFISAMPGNIFSISVFDAAQNRILSNISGISFSPGMFFFPFTAMTAGDALIAYFIAKERDWIPVLEKFDGLAINGKTPPINSFPLIVQNKTFDCTIEKSSGNPDEMNFSENLFTIKLNGDEIGVYSARDCKILGYSLLSEEFPEYIIVYISTLQSGFEGEKDSIIKLAGAYLGFGHQDIPPQI